MSLLNLHSDRKIPSVWIIGAFSLFLLIAGMISLRRINETLVWIPFAVLHHVVLWISLSDISKYKFDNRNSKSLFFNRYISLGAIVMWAYASYLAFTFPSESSFLTRNLHVIVEGWFLYTWIASGFLYILPIFILLRSQCQKHASTNCGSDYPISIDADITIFCDNCQYRGSIDEFGKPIRQKENAKWYQLSHEYVLRQCPNCGHYGKMELRSYGLPMLVAAMVFAGSTFPLVLDSTYLVVLIFPGLILLWLRRNDLLVFETNSTDKDLGKGT